MSPTLPASDTLASHYTRARQLMQHVTAVKPEDKLAFNATITPHWLPEGSSFWYEQQTSQGKQYRLVDAAAASNTAAFDHQQLASALSEASQHAVDKHQLPLAQLTLQCSPLQLSFDAFDQRWTFDGEQCKPVASAAPTGISVSPDGNYEVKAQDNNLWLYNLNDDTEQPRPLTHDGEEHYAYGDAPNMVAAGHVMGPLAELQVLWSPDSKRLLAVQLDMRQVESLPVVHHVPQDGSLRPQLEEYKYPMPGDTHMPEYRLVVIDIESGEITPAAYPPVCFAYIIPFFTDGRSWWAPDSELAYFVDLKRGSQQVQVIELNTGSGETRVVFEERSSSWINLHPGNYHGPSQFKALPETNELIWYSERSGWAHLYLYDLSSGKVKNVITEGEWVVQDILDINAISRELFLSVMGRDSNRNPYYRDIVRVHMDTGELTIIMSGDCDCAGMSALHPSINDLQARAIGGRDIGDARTISHSGNYAVITCSRADTIPKSFLLDRNGETVLLLETADMAALYARVSNDWLWPERVKVKSADNQTDLFGLIYRPSNFSPDKSYPVINETCSSPDLPWLPAGSFTNNLFYGKGYLEPAALAELGFIVVQMDARGTSFRNKAFQDESYGCIESTGDLKDNIAGLKQLAERYPYMDLDRVGIYSPLGGTGAIQGLFHYPEFFKVGVHGFVHDSRLMSAPMWSEKYEGLDFPSKDHGHAEDYADKLSGKLLLMGGMLDSTTPPASMFRIIEALQRSNKDFDLILLPSLGHAGSSYLTRRTWDYFLKHLRGVTLDREFLLKTWRDI